MEWLDRFNRAMDYIEAHLDGEISYDQAAKLAGCSTFHFQRIFSYIADIPLSEYIRHRRMTLAAVDLQTTGEKIIDIGLKYGYESPTAFTRAFQRQHGLPPTAARAKGVTLKAFPRITFSVTIKGDVEMHYRIEEKGAFRIVGVKEHIAMSVEEGFRRVPEFWKESAAKGAIPKLCAVMNGQPMGLLGVSVEYPEQGFDYYIAVSSDRPCPEGMEEYLVPASTWAVFTSVGPLPEALQTMQKRVVAEWLPSSGYEYADAPDIEVYSDGDQSASDYRCEIWLPVVKK